MTVPGVRTLAHAELGTRPSAVMRRPWRRASGPNRRVLLPRGTPVVQADVRFARASVTRLSVIGWLVLFATQTGAATTAGATFLITTAKPPAGATKELALIPPPQPRRAVRARRRAAARPAPASPAIERPTVAAVMASVTEQSESIQACMRQAIVRGDLVRDTSYQFNLDWVITPAGSVSSPQVAVPPEVAGATLGSCLRAAMTGWRFPVSQRGVTVRRFPFHFTVRLPPTPWIIAPPL